MHRDVSPFVLSCGAVLKYFCTNVGITFQKCILRCISVLCNLYYFHWNIRALNQVDHELYWICTQWPKFVGISLLNHWKCFVSPKLFSPLKFCMLVFSSVFTILKKQFWKRKQLSSTLQLHCLKFYVKIY